MSERAKWEYNVGEILLSVTECFWMFPSRFFYNTALCITSAWFSYEGETWRFVKVPNLRSDNFVTLYLWKEVRRCPSSPEYIVEVSLKSPDDTTVLRKSMLENCSENLNNDFGYACYKFCNILEFERRSVSRCGLMKLFFVIQKKEGILDSLTSITEIEANADSKNDDEPELEKNDESELKGVDRLLQNFKNLMLDEQSSDVLLKVEDHEFKAHRGILKVRSPVFASMFQPHTKESTTGIVDIPDCSASAFEVFLLYIYTANANVVSPNNVFDLYYVADKYQIYDLKSECVQFMENNLSVDSFCEVITLSIQHSESSLQKVATRFFCDNVKTIIKTVQWQKYMKDYSTEANELYIKAINA